MIKYSRHHKAQVENRQKQTLRSRPMESPVCAFVARRDSTTNTTGGIDPPPRKASMDTMLSPDLSLISSFSSATRASAGRNHCTNSRQAEISSKLGRVVALKRGEARGKYCDVKRWRRRSPTGGGRASLRGSLLRRGPQGGGGGAIRVSYLNENVPNLLRRFFSSCDELTNYRGATPNFNGAGCTPMTTCGIDR